MASKEEIIKLVKGIVKSGVQVEINIAGELYSTRFLHYDSEGEFVFSDQLIPKSGNQILRPEQIYSIKQDYFDAGMIHTIRFSAPYIKSAIYNELPAHSFGFPVEIRRKANAYDVEPRPSDNVSVAFVLKPLKTEQHVTSLNIRSLQFKGSIPVPVKSEGIPVRDVSLKLPQTEVRFNANLIRVTKYIYRLEYHEIFPEAFTALNHYISERYSESVGFRKPSSQSESNRPGVVYKPKEKAPKYKGKVFVVDDQLMVTDLLSRVLTRSGYFCRTYNDGNKLIESAVKHKPDIILLDIKMPDYDGFTLCRRIKRDPRTSHISVIMLTAASSRDDVLEAKDAGAELYLVKSPNMKMNEVVERVDSIMERRLNH